LLFLSAVAAVPRFVVVCKVYPVVFGDPPNASNKSILLRI